jgi:hypothetical protein
MIETKRGWQAGVWLAGCFVASSAIFGAAAQDGASTLTDAIPPLEDTTLPGPLEPMVRRYYRDSPDCVSAKLDVWFGHHRVLYWHAVRLRQCPQQRTADRRPESYSSDHLTRRGM